MDVKASFARLKTSIKTKSSLKLTRPVMVWRHFLVGVIFWFNGMSCCVLKYFICCSKNQQCFDLTCLQKLCKLVYLFVQLEIWHLKDILSQTVLIPSMPKNFVKTDWSIETSQIPTLKFPPYSILNHIEPLNSNILFIVYQRK